LFLVLLAWIGVIGAHGPVWYTNQLITKYYMQWHGISPSVASQILFFATLGAVWVYVLFGHLSDKVGRRKILLLGIYGNALLFIPIFWLMRQAALAENIAMLCGLVYICTFFNGIGYSGAQSAFLLELFPSRIRLTATAFTYNLGYGITGGLTPFMITLIYRFVQDWFIAVISWSTVLPMIMGLFFLIKGKETLGTRIWSEFVADKFKKEAVVVNANDTIRDAINKMIAKNGRGLIVDYGTGVGVAYRRLLRGAVEKGLDAPIGEIALKTPCVEINEPLPNVLEVMDHQTLGPFPCARREGSSG